MTRAIAILICGLLGAHASAYAKDSIGLAPWSENPWYWSYRGEPVLLLGGSDDDNLFQWPQDDLVEQLDRIAEAGGNVVRNTISDRSDKEFEVYPFARLSNGKYDLDDWNAEYWLRFDRFLQETARRQIVVQIEIWDRFDFTDNGGRGHWQASPYNPANNVNYTYEQSGFARSYPDHPGRNLQPFFFTTPEQRNNETVLRYQREFVSKLLEHALRFDHVLYCIDNETSGDEEWSRFWAQFIKECASLAGERIQVTEMWDDWDLRGATHKRTFDHPELYDYVDVSQNNHNSGQEHWDNFLYVRDYLSPVPRPMNTTKTYGADRNKFGHSDQDAVERFWRHLLAGAASIRFHRPPAGLGINDTAVKCIRTARLLEDIVPLWSLTPDNDALSERDANEAYASVFSGEVYVVYFPRQGSVKLRLPESDRPWTLTWLHAGSAAREAEVNPGGLPDLELTTPDGDNWIAVVQQR